MMPIRTPHMSWWVPIVFAAGLSVAGTVYLNSKESGETFTKRTADRLTTVETQQQDTTRRLDRIESKLDRMIEWGPGTGRQP